MKSTPTFIEACTPETLQQAEAIRYAVFADEQGIPPELVEDGLDALSRHALALIGTQPAATGRLTILSHNAGTLARIAVLPRFRGQRLGQDIVIFLEGMAHREGLHQLTLQAHTHLESFYARLGYESIPERTLAGPYELVVMTKTLLPS